jgi:hypothetical protein
MPATDGKVGDIATQLGGTNYGAPWAGGEGGGGGGGFAPNGLGARPTFNFPGAPVFKYPKFHAPSQEEAQKEPGYQFRLDAGQQALERSASAKGILRTGGTLKDFVEYGQNFGAAEYNNVFNRALQGYDREYRGAYDAFAPQLADYNNRFRAETASGLAAYDRDWQQYVFANTPHGGGGGGGGPIDPPPEPPDVSAYGNRDDDWKEYEFAA